MEVSDANVGRVLRAARVAARRESGWLLLDAGLTALVVWIAVCGLVGIAPAVLGFAAGITAADTARGDVGEGRRRAARPSTAGLVGLVPEQVTR